MCQWNLWITMFPLTGNPQGPLNQPDMTSSDPTGQFVFDMFTLDHRARQGVKLFDGAMFLKILLRWENLKDCRGHRDSWTWLSLNDATELNLTTQGKSLLIYNFVIRSNNVVKFELTWSMYCGRLMWSLDSALTCRNPSAELVNTRAVSGHCSVLRRAAHSAK